MTEENSFAALLQRVRGGQADAAAELVKAYEPEIRRAVRVWLTAPGMRRAFDSMDICQSVLANFFVRAATGQLDLERPEQLLGLLAAMARNKVIDLVRKEQAGRRDSRRRAGAEALEGVADRQETPSQVVAARELLDETLRRLSGEERVLAEQRALGRGWAEIAAELGGTPDGLRMRLGRAIDRVARELHLDDIDRG